MVIRLAEKSPEAYSYPLLIKHLLHTPLITSAGQEIIYRDRSRHTYAEFAQRLARLANGLTTLGVTSGNTVAVMEWDSHRYLECYFAVPMLGAVLQTVNVRLAPQEILFTLQNTGARFILVNRDFLPLLAQIHPQLPDLEGIVLMDDSPPGPDRLAGIDSEYERLLAEADGDFEFPDFDEHAIAAVFHTAGTTGRPKGVSFSHRQIVLLALTACGALASPVYGQSPRHGDVYMPLTPMFHVYAWGAPYVATMLGLKQVYPGRYVAGELIALRIRESVTFSHCEPEILQMLLSAATESEELRGWRIVMGGAALAPGLAEAALRAGVDVFASG